MSGYAADILDNRIIMENGNNFHIEADAAAGTPGEDQEILDA